MKRIVSEKRYIEDQIDQLQKRAQQLRSKWDGSADPQYLTDREREELSRLYGQGDMDCDRLKELEAKRENWLDTIRKRPSMKQRSLLMDEVIVINNIIEVFKGLLWQYAFKGRIDG